LTTTLQKKFHCNSLCRKIEAEFNRLIRYRRPELQILEKVVFTNVFAGRETFADKSQLVLLAFYDAPMNFALSDESCEKKKAKSLLWQTAQ
jgi:hypothetical protein